MVSLQIFFEWKKKHVEQYRFLIRDSPSAHATEGNVGGV